MGSCFGTSRLLRDHPHSEHYKDLHAFFDVLPNIMRDETARFSFFHGAHALYTPSTGLLKVAHRPRRHIETSLRRVYVRNGGLALAQADACLYRAVAEMHLREIGLSTTWTDVPVQDGGEVTWQGITRKCAFALLALYPPSASLP